MGGGWGGIQRTLPSSPMEFPHQPLLISPDGHFSQSMRHFLIYGTALPSRQPPSCSPTRSTRTFHIMIIIIITIIIIILLLHQPQRLLEHQKIAFQHLGPILHMANLIDTFGRPIELPLPFRALFSESRRLFLELGLLLGNGGGVGV